MNTSEMAMKTQLIPLLERSEMFAGEGKPKKVATTWRWIIPITREVDFRLSTTSRYCEIIVFPSVGTDNARQLVEDFEKSAEGARFELLNRRDGFKGARGHRYQYGDNRQSAIESLLADATKIYPTIRSFFVGPELSASADEASPAAGIDEVPSQDPHAFAWRPEKKDWKQTTAQIDRTPLKESSQLHDQVERSYAKHLFDQGFSPTYEPGEREPPFDLKWALPDGSISVGEVKTVTPENEVRQVRAGIGQLLDYHSFYDTKTPVNLVLVLNHPLQEDRLARTCAKAGIEIAVFEE